MTFQYRNERGVRKIYDTRTHKLYWLDSPKGVMEIVELLNNKAAPQCSHEWVSAVNEVVVSGEICSKCLAVRPAPPTGTPEP